MQNYIYRVCGYLCIVFVSDLKNSRCWVLGMLMENQSVEKMIFVRYLRKWGLTMESWNELLECREWPQSQIIFSLSIYVSKVGLASHLRFYDWSVPSRLLTTIHNGLQEICQGFFVFVFFKNLANNLLSKKTLACYKNCNNIL